MMITFCLPYQRGLQALCFVISKKLLQEIEMEKLRFALEQPESILT